MTQIKPAIIANQKLLRMTKDNKPYYVYFTEQTIKQIYDEFMKNEETRPYEMFISDEDAEGIPKGSLMVKTDKDVSVEINGTKCNLNGEIELEIPIPCNRLDSINPICPNSKKEKYLELCEKLEKGYSKCLLQKVETIYVNPIDYELLDWAMNYDGKKTSTFRSTN